MAYPEKRYFNYTAFFVKDELLKEKYGITKALGKDDPTSLESLAHGIYDDVYPEDADIDDLKDRRNALNRFISYHIIDRYGSTYTLTANDNTKLQNHFNRRKHDISDWYQTLMPHSLMKFSFPNGTQAGLYINRRGRLMREVFTSVVLSVSLRLLRSLSMVTTSISMISLLTITRLSRSCSERSACVSTVLHCRLTS